MEFKRGAYVKSLEYCNKSIKLLDSYSYESLVPFNTFISENTKHPGAGKSYIIDNVLTNEFLEYIYNQFLIVPVFEIKKDKACSDRSYYCDYNGLVSNYLSKVIFKTLVSINSDDNNNVNNNRVYVFPHMRFLHYKNQGYFNNNNNYYYCN
jgi:hypothetical protein